MIPKGQIRVIWKSPRLPGDPVWVVHKELPPQMIADLKAALQAMPTSSPEAWKDLVGETSRALKEVGHKDYEDIIQIRKENLKQRKGG
jgi:ABC-type phosphate/phosphonate transport system substrate-binding protein